MTVKNWYSAAISRLMEHEGEAMIILRHAHRHPITDTLKHELAMLTDEGKECSKTLGSWLAENGFNITSCMASPVRRCEETAELILQGYGKDMDIQTVRLLGNIDPFIDDEEAAEITFRLMHMRDICNGLLDGDVLPGFKDIVSGLKPLVNDLHSHRWGELTLVVTHDFFVASLAGHALGMCFRGEEWIGFVEPMLLLREGDHTKAWFRGQEGFLF